MSEKMKKDENSSENLYTEDDFDIDFDAQKSVLVKFKKLDPEAQLPKQAYPGDAGMDLYANESVELCPRRADQNWEGRQVVQCGFAMALPEGWEAQIRPRSGWASKKGLTVINSPGTIDSRYTGEICVALINLGIDTINIKKGDRIAQMVISEVPRVEVREVDELPESERGSQGFGSSGD